MKTLAQLFSILTLVIGSSAVNASEDMLFTEKGYPYKPLVERADKVKIIYSEENNIVHCRVLVEMAGNTWRGNQVHITTKAFNAAPLYSCLARDKAKQILAATYDLS